MSQIFRATEGGGEPGGMGNRLIGASQEIGATADLGEDRTP